MLQTLQIHVLQTHILTELPVLWCMLLPDVGG